MSSAPSIPFNLPPRTGTEAAHVARALERGYLTAGPYHAQCRDWMQARMQRTAMLTPSCTHALEMCALLLDLKPGDEVIMPSFTFVSSANAFAMHGAVPVFVDIRPDTMNIDETLIEAAITPRTRAILVMHYAGVACAMDEILAIASKHKLAVVEDAAHALLASYRGRLLGTLGDLGTFSFHETKIISSGEGGCLLVNDPRYAARADDMRYKGTNRTAFHNKETAFYTWTTLGSSWCMGELASAYLWGNLQSADAILARRQQLWQRYHEAFAPLAGRVTLPTVPEGCIHNGTVYYLKCKSKEARNACIAALKSQGIEVLFHYVPLHTSPAGKQYGRFHGQDHHTTAESDKLLRIPLFYGLSDPDQSRVIEAIQAHFA